VSAIPSRRVVASGVAALVAAAVGVAVWWGSQSATTAPPATRAASSLTVPAGLTPAARQAVSSQIEAGRQHATPAGQVPKTPIVTNPAAAPAVGIQRGNQGPFASEVFRNTSEATVQTSSGYVTVFAGETGAGNPLGPSKPAVTEYADPADANSGQAPSAIGTYPLPCPGPDASISALAGTDVMVTCSSGQVESFDPVTHALS
jgi:hypothetical protein